MEIINLNTRLFIDGKTKRPERKCIVQGRNEIQLYMKVVECRSFLNWETSILPCGLEFGPSRPWVE